MIKKVKVICPVCGREVPGEIEVMIPWNSYNAYCDHCEYIIMESEWEEVKDV